jgi:transcriptional regulator with XRE-family HTH domain
MTLGAAVRAARKHRGWTQQDLAYASGLSRTHICNIEATGFKTTTKRIQAFAWALDVTFIVTAHGWTWAPTKDDTMGNLATYLDPSNYGHDDPPPPRVSCRKCNGSGRVIIGHYSDGSPVDELCECYQGKEDPRD